MRIEGKEEAYFKGWGERAESVHEAKWPVSNIFEAQRILPIALVTLCIRQILWPRNCAVKSMKS